MEQFLQFLNTVWGSFLKVFVAAVLGQYLVMMTTDPKFQVFHWNKEKSEILAKSGLIGLIPVVINYLNRKDARYGLKEEPKDDEDPS